MTSDPTSKERSPRPQKTSESSHYNWLMDLARWCGIEWHISSMHATAENAIMKAADQKDEIERLRAALIQARHLCADAHEVVCKALSGDSTLTPEMSDGPYAFAVECSGCKRNLLLGLRRGSYVFNVKCVCGVTTDTDYSRLRPQLDTRELSWDQDPDNPKNQLAPSAEEPSLICVGCGHDIYPAEGAIGHTCVCGYRTSLAPKASEKDWTIVECSKHGRFHAAWAGCSMCNAENGKTDSGKP